MPDDIGSAGLVVHDEFFPNVKRAGQKDSNETKIDVKKYRVQQQAFKYSGRDKKANE